MNEFTICLTDEQKKIFVKIVHEKFCCGMFSEVSDSDIADYIKKLVLDEISFFEYFGSYWSLGNDENE